MPMTKTEAKGPEKKVRKSAKAGYVAAGASRTKSARQGQAHNKNTETLRRRLLGRLAEGPVARAQLGEAFDSAGSSISRTLASLREEGLVISEGGEEDRRLVTYSLTEPGEVALNRLVAFGSPEKPPEIDPERQVRLLRSALDRAIRLRREANRLGEAAARLRGVVREAEKIEASEIALEAMAELAKTLRQNRQPEDQNEIGPSFEGMIERLNAIALGNDPRYGAELAMPAAAHLKYTLGRAGERRGEDLSTREAHLTAACSLYAQLARNTAMPVRREWFGRQAWSVISLAGNLRKQTQLEKALRFATLAKHGFDLIEDEYGRAHCYFMFGFCLRLLGEFREAAVCLDHAYEIADQRSYQRARADTLMQMGEVKRCLGELDDANDLLIGSLSEASGMDLFVTQAFALSALGAVEFQKGEFGQAREYLSQSQELFDGCEHIEGRALNSRRDAAVSRRIATDSANPNYAAIERLAESAHRGYEGLNSPPGRAACAVEKGRVQLLRKGGRVTPVIDYLSSILASPSQCLLLELDPWVPQLVNEFAEEAQDDKLVEESGWVLAEAQKILAEKGAQSVERIATVMDIKVEEEDEIPSDAAQMGGEARREFEGADSDLTVLDRELLAVA